MPSVPRCDTVQILRLATLDVLADTGVANVEALLYQYTMYVLFFQTLFAHTSLSTLRIFLQPVFNLGAYRLCHAGTLDMACRILWLAGKADVQPLLRILPDRVLILTDVTCYGLPVKTYSTGDLPQTQTINTMVMKDLFFLIHLNHL